MNETGIGETLSVDPGPEVLRLLRQSVTDTLDRLGLKPGYRVFGIHGPEYDQITLDSKGDDKDLIIELVTAKERVAASTDGEPYSLKCQHTLCLNPSSLRHNFYDSLDYHYPGFTNGEFDSELRTGETIYNFPEPLPDPVSKLLGDALKIMPTLTSDQYDLEESYDNLEPDPEKQRQLESLKNAISTAGGAFSMLQLALDGPIRKQIADGSVGEFGEYGCIVIPPSGLNLLNELTVSAYLEDSAPKPANSSAKSIVIDEKKSSFTVNGYKQSFRSSASHLLYIRDGHQLTYDVTDTLKGQTADDAVDIDVTELYFDLDQELPERIVKFIERAIRTITTSGMTEA